MALLGSKIKPSAPQGDHGELWIVSYADMMTLLFGFFVILYSISAVDEKRFSAVGKELAEAFGGKEKKTESLAEVGMRMEERQIRALQLLVAMLNLGENIDEAVQNIENRVAEAKNMDAARDMVMENLKPKNKGVLANLQATTVNREDRIEIAFPDSMLFESGTADLTPTAKLGLKRIAGFLSKVKDLIGIEIVGHTDSAPPSRKSRYPSNWALSSARAGAVAEEILKYGVASKSLMTRGMASVQPLFAETKEDGTLIHENMAKNRRVHIIVRKAGSTSHGEGQ